MAKSGKLGIGSTVKGLIPIIIATVAVVGVFRFHLQNTEVLQNQIGTLTATESKLRKQLIGIDKELRSVKSEDQYLLNKTLQSEIGNIKTTYQKAVTTYEKLLDLKDVAKNTDKFDKLFSSSLTYLSEKNYASADATLTSLSQLVTAEKEKIAAQFTIAASVAVNNAAPGAGYRRQKVSTDIGDFQVDIIAADLGNTRVVVDTASAGDCRDNCPVLPLSDYVSRSGAFGGINGAYFCPASYPSCAGKTNSFDTLLMNKNKVYFNSDNNVYSTVPAVIFGGGWIRFVGRSLDWGRDTGIDSMIANQPLLVSDGNVVFGGDGDPKKGSKGPRSFVGANGNTVYIGIVFNATVAEAARVLKTLGLTHALNLDSGGSTALWSGGYRVGPGRNIPNAILFVRK